MIRPWAVAAAVILGAAAQQGCGPSSAKDASFSGTWKLIEENGVANTRVEHVVEVAADKGRFRISSKTDGAETIQVFDGESLHTKTVYPPRPAAPPPLEGGERAPEAIGQAPSPSPVSTIQPNAAVVNRMRFWARSYVGKAGSGGQIAGRETVLYQAREKRPDGEITVQAWTDAGTGVVLKSVSTIYSSQVNSMVVKTTEECQEIRFGPVDEASFGRP